MSNEAGEIVGNRQAGEELLAGDIAPIQRNLNILNDEVFISLCLRKIKDQCRHIQLPFFTDPHRVRVDATKNDPNQVDWLPFVCYIRRPYGNSQIHLVMTNFFSGPGLNITVWSPQFTILDCRNKRSDGADTYYLDRMNVLARELDVSVDDNFTQIFNCNIGNNAEYNFAPVVPIFSVEKQVWETAEQDGSAPFNLHSLYALNCICMVKHIVLEIQKYQRMRRSNRFRNNRDRPSAIDLVPIVFTNFNRLLNHLGFHLNGPRYEFSPELLRASRYRYADRREKRSYRVTITEIHLQDFFGHLNNTFIHLSEYLANIIEWSMQITNFFAIRTSRLPAAPKRTFHTSLIQLTQTWHMICQSLTPLFAAIPQVNYMQGFERIILTPHPEFLRVIENANANLQQSLASRQRIVQELEPSQYTQRTPRLATALNRIAVAARRRATNRRRRNTTDNIRPNIFKSKSKTAKKSTKKKKTSKVNYAVNQSQYGAATTSTTSPVIPLDLNSIDTSNVIDDINNNDTSELTDIFNQIPQSLWDDLGVDIDNGPVNNNGPDNTDNGPDNNE